MAPLDCSNMYVPNPITSSKSRTSWFHGHRCCVFLCSLHPILITLFLGLLFMASVCFNFTTCSSSIIHASASCRHVVSLHMCLSHSHSTTLHQSNIHTIDPATHRAVN